MKRKKKIKILALMLAALMLTGISPLKVYAADAPIVENVGTFISTQKIEKPDFYQKGIPDSFNIGRNSNYLVGCDITAAFMSYGLHIQLETSTTQTASKLGVKDVKIQEKNGIFWNTILSSDGNYITNDDWFIGAIDCKNAVDGKTYRIKCTHYAYIGGNYYHYDNTTDGFKYVKP